MKVQLNSTTSRAALLASFVVAFAPTSSLRAAVQQSSANAAHEADEDQQRAAKAAHEAEEEQQRANTNAAHEADEDQQRAAETKIAELTKAKKYSRQIVTRLEHLDAFYPAEAYHQDFLVRNPNYPYILINDAPKIASLKKLLPQDYRAQPVLTGQN